ncbi:MAG: PadR family transcriptional regulator [Rhodobiaceae bacterium]|nr:PadR family transcriptional regulator [Rhodobiaceae bacterium]
MNIRTLCLAILSAGDATGYEIRKSSMEGKYSYFVDASYGAIYPALNKLEADGCVTCREEIHPGKPARKVYSITEAGRAELVAALCEAPGKDVFRSEFLLIAMSASRLPRAVIERAIATREAQLTEELEQIRSLHMNAQDPGAIWVCEYGMACMGQSLSHLQSTKAQLLAATGGETETGRQDAAE